MVTGSQSLTEQLVDANRVTTRKEQVPTELTITYACEHARRHEWYTENVSSPISSFRRRLRAPHDELCAECREEEIWGLRKSNRDYEVVDTLMQRICEDDGQVRREDLSKVSIFDDWREATVQVLEVRCKLRARLKLVEGQRKKLARRLKDLDIKNLDESDRISSS